MVVRADCDGDPAGLWYRVMTVLDDRYLARNLCHQNVARDCSLACRSPEQVVMATQLVCGTALRLCLTDVGLLACNSTKAVF